MKYIYSPETLISPHTNRPITNDAKDPQPPVYWCKVCYIKLASPSTALQHVYGRPHRNKAKKDYVDQRNSSNTLKHKQPPNPRNTTHDHVGQEPVAKKSKEQQSQPVNSDPNLRCDDCKIVFDTLVKSVEHFKYTRHEFSARRDQVEQPTENISLHQNNAVDFTTHVNAVKSNVQQPVGKDVEGKPAKTVESEPVGELKCDDCKVSFVNGHGSREHFQGKRHKKVIAAKEAALQKSVLSMWQKSGTGTGLDVGARGGGRASRFGRSRNVRPGPKVPSLSLTSTQGIGRSSQVYSNYSANPNPVMNVSGNSFPNMQRNTNNVFYGNSIPSNYGASQYQNSNYGTPHQISNYATPQQTDNYATPQYQASKYETPQYQSHSAQDMYKSSNQVNLNDSYSRASPPNAIKDNYSSGNQNNNYSYFNENY